MDFIAEIIRTTQRKLVSNDNQYEVVLRTPNPNVLDLGKLPADTIFDISITLNHTTNPENHKKNATNGVAI